MLLKNGINTKHDVVLSLDWSRSAVHVYDPRTDEVTVYSNIEEFTGYVQNVSLILESTAESYELDRRLLVLEAFKAANIDPWGYDPKFTARYRDENDIEKTDTNDARVIYKVGTETSLVLHRFGPLRNDDVLRDEITKYVVLDRSGYDGALTMKLTEKYFGVQGRKKTFNNSIPEQFRPLMYGSNRAYRKQIGRILYTAEMVRKAKRGYDEFRRQIGDYGNGYGSIMHSEVFHHLMMGQVKQQMKELGIKATRVSRMTDGEERMVRQWTPAERQLKKETMRLTRKLTRYLWDMTATGATKLVPTLDAAFEF